ncbi:anaphase-promoting complex subunit 1 isoform X4 [Salvelinus fontinalis]|uniref:anaphase-promoting complex subunit 1 isoform X4 n=1 Tax=Salvelinus fontinalis TaxID=8038 RepID=UPI002485E1BB|nr:anaphase-promoting complex subunit 1 isoform X4 [Salvelinus fontinalis]
MSLQQKVRECWLLRKGSSVDSDENEELYAAGNMVIWSRGSKSHASHVYKAFTVGSPVVQSRMLWNRLCIVPRSCVNGHSVTPKDLISPLHFQVSNVWPTKFGLLLECKSPAPEAPPSPSGNLFPLYSVCCTLWMRVVCRPTGLFEAACVQYVSDSTMKIVFFNCKPSIVI